MFKPRTLDDAIAAIAALDDKAANLARELEWLRERVRKVEGYGRDDYETLRQMGNV